MSSITKLSLISRKNIKQVEPTLQKLASTIQTNLGLESLKLDIDYLEFVNIILRDAPTSGWDANPGDCVTWYLEPLASNTGKFKDDEMTQEAFVDVVGKDATLGFTFSEETSGFYNRIKLEEGKILIEVAKGRINSNCDDCGRNIEELL